MFMCAQSPIGYHPVDEMESEDTPDEATSFDAETHISFLRETFRIFDVDINNWYVNLVGDNETAISRMANLVSKP